MYHVKLNCGNHFYIFADIDKKCIVAELNDKLKQEYELEDFQLQYKGRILYESDKLSNLKLKENSQFIIKANSMDKIFHKNFDALRCNDKDFNPNFTRKSIKVEHKKENDHFEIKNEISIFNKSAIARNILLLFFSNGTKYKQIMTLAFNEGILDINYDQFELITCDDALESLRRFQDVISTDLETTTNYDVVATIFKYFEINTPIESLKPNQKIEISRAAQLIKYGIDILQKQDIEVFPELFPRVDDTAAPLKIKAVKTNVKT